MGFSCRRCSAALIGVEILLSLAAASPALAKQVVFVKEYVYQASEADSKVTCRAIALEQVKRLLLEEVGTYVQSETAVKDFQLSRDQVITMTAGVVGVEVLNEQWDGVRYTLNARITVDPQQVTDALDNLRGNAVERDELEAAKKQNESSLREIERLRTELAALRAGDPSSGERADALKQKERHYVQSVAAIEMNNLLEKGATLLETGENEAALTVYQEAIRLEPGNKRASMGRGAAYARLNRTSEALKDFDRANEIDPSFAKPYLARGKVYRKLGKYRESLKNLDRAIELNPYFAQAFYERGMSNLKVGEKRSGIDDLKRAANMGFKKAREALLVRGIQY